MNTQSVNTSLYQKGDISLERIYGKYRNSFIRYAGKVLSDEFYAEDVVQDVFTGLFQQTNYFVSEMAALKCIYKLAKTDCFSFKRFNRTNASK